MSAEEERQQNDGWSALQAIERLRASQELAFARMEAKFDTEFREYKAEQYLAFQAMQGTISRRNEAVDARFGTLENRMTTAEKFQAFLKGGGKAVAGFTGLVLSIVGILVWTGVFH